ncbi:hypothetical protein LNKW23_18150 [Paralimibaculum aggregatum]|uniref:Uncharacterized protein n=1 Tax=Paralimibaculum aggregatum TaxID=3036245 RepID=A0ABQ6LHY6_9RHOB|nr:hypothetical protein [Limibaculum sp. NKW23]GMG82602.1 hypothetical protein LNKW23_18150 [Limibaculum sp. NKW23]
MNGLGSRILLRRADGGWEVHEAGGVSLRVAVDELKGDPDVAEIMCCTVFERWQRREDKG